MQKFNSLNKVNCDNIRHLALGSHGIAIISVCDIVCDTMRTDRKQPARFQAIVLCAVKQI